MVSEDSTSRVMVFPVRLEVEREQNREIESEEEERRGSRESRGRRRGRKGHNVSFGNGWDGRAGKAPPNNEDVEVDEERELTS